VILELCGLPGAGKSTVARALVAEIGRRGGEASLPLEEVSPRRARRDRVRRKVRRAAVEAIGHPGDAVRTVRAVGRSGQPRRSDVAIRSLNWLVLRAALRRSRDEEGIHVIDQGVVQELSSLAFRGDARAAIDVADPGEGSLGPDLVVLVDVDPAVAEHRLAGRPGRESRVEGDDVDRRRELMRQRDVLDDLIAAWMTRFGDRVPTVVARVDDGGHGVDLDELLTLLRLPDAGLDPRFDHVPVETALNLT
jgi:AAA domain